MQVLETETERLSLLITDILDVSKLEQGIEAFDMRPTNINDLIQNVIDVNRGMVSDKGLTLDFSSGNNIPILVVDPERMTQVFTNLIGNAISYTESGSVKVMTKLRGDEVTITVKDSGLGIDSEDLSLIFDRFYRGSRARMSTIPGTGLGLAIAQEIVNIHGGTIDVTSTVGLGSIFTVKLTTKIANDEPR